MNKKTRILAAVTGVSLGLASLLSFAACGEKEEVPEGSTEITFWYDSGLETQSVYRELVQTYNEGQGVEDGVYVLGSRKVGISESARMQITGGTPPNVVMISDTVFRTYAIEGLFHDMTEFYEEQPGDYSEEEIPENMVNRFRITVGENGQKTVVGEGETLYGVPFGNDPNVLFYNVGYFEEQGINIISVPEEELDAYNEEHGTNFAAHGYAEYKPGYLTGDAASLSASTSIAGDQVVKVFNNAIPTNWEEFRQLNKYFTKQYNPSSTTERGFGNEWWFANSWSVGSDCIGWDGEKYNFTLADETPNYLVTADSVTINGVEYTAGETVRYEDKIAEPGIATMEGVYELPSQRDALMEFLCMTGSTDVIVDGSVTGYGVGYADGYYRSDGFLHEESVIISSGFSGRIGFDRALGDDFDMAVSYQYREYEGGSVYYEGGTGFGNEYLKVIGETYDGDVYTGELKEENGTPIEGNLTIHDCATALVIPERSDSSKYEAAWKFIRWAAGPEGQAILAKTGNVVPNQDSIALSDTFYSVGGEKNFYAAALMSRGSDVGDWGYFENGEWVTDWSSDFNNRLRMGIDTLSDFLANNQEMAQTACAETTIRIKGWR